MLEIIFAGFFYARDISSHCGCLPNLFALGDETASVIYPTERQPFFLSALDKSLMQMKALISTALRSRKSVTLPGATSRAKSSTPALGSFADFCLGMFGVLLFAIALLAIYVFGGEMAYAGAMLLILPFIARAIRKGGDQ